MKDRELLVAEILTELSRARGRFPQFHSPHEGFAVLLEEVDELWDEVKCKHGSVSRSIAMHREAVQVAAMAIRFVEDVCPFPATVKEAEG